MLMARPALIPMPCIAAILFMVAYKRNAAAGISGCSSPT